MPLLPEATPSPYLWRPRLLQIFKAHETPTSINHVMCQAICVNTCVCARPNNSRAHFALQKSLRSGPWDSWPQQGFQCSLFQRTTAKYWHLYPRYFGPTVARCRADWRRPKNFGGHFEHNRHNATQPLFYYVLLQCHSHSPSRDSGTGAMGNEPAKVKSGLRERRHPGCHDHGYKADRAGVAQHREAVGDSPEDGGRWGQCGLQVF